MEICKRIPVKRKWFLVGIEARCSVRPRETLSVLRIKRIYLLILTTGDVDFPRRRNEREF